MRSCARRSTSAGSSPIDTSSLFARFRRYTLGDSFGRPTLLRFPRSAQERANFLARRIAAFSDPDRREVAGGSDPDGAAATLGDTACEGEPPGGGSMPGHRPGGRGPPSCTSQGAILGRPAVAVVGKPEPARVARPPGRTRSTRRSASVSRKCSLQRGVAGGPWHWTRLRPEGDAARADSGPPPYPDPPDFADAGVAEVRGLGRPPPTSPTPVSPRCEGSATGDPPDFADAGVAELIGFSR